MSCYETYFQDYCQSEVSKYAKENKWTSEKKAEILRSIDFNSFKSTIYNVFSFYSSNELKDIISLLQQLNENREMRVLFITNRIIENNLRHFSQSIIEGKYVK